MSKDPMWIPKPPVLYGSDKLEIFQPYDPETPVNITPPASPPCPGSPSDSSSSGSVTMPSVLTLARATPPVSTSATVAATQSTCSSISDKDLKTSSSDKTPLNTILKTLFGNKQSDSTVSSDGNSAKTTVSAKKMPVFSQVSRTMVDPIVQQYGQKSRIKEIEVEESELDRPYDPEEEYDPTLGFETVAPQTMKKMMVDDPTLSGIVEDDVAYDPEDETIFEDIQSGIAVKRPPVPTKTLDPSLGPTEAPSSTPAQTSVQAAVKSTLPAGTVVVSAATLSEQQRMLEELNKQIEEQKRQLKEQEEALRQQRETVGMFMAHFSVSDSLMSPPSKSLPLSQLSSLQSGIMRTDSKLSDSTGSTANLTETVENSNMDSQIVKLEDTTAVHNLKNDTETVAEQDDTQENIEKCDKYSSAGEIEDSDVAYDPEDESLFNEIQEDVFKGTSIKASDSLSRAGHSDGHKGTSPNSYHSRKRRSSPKRRSHRERDHHRSPSRKSQRRSPSRSRRRRDRDRHRRSERDRSRHRVRDPSERQGRHHKDHSTRRHSHGRRRSPSSPRKKDSVSLSPKPHRGPFPQVLEKSKHATALDSVVEQFVESNTSSLPATVKKDLNGPQLECSLVESTEKDFTSCLQVKLEPSEPPKFQELLKNSTPHPSLSGSSTQVDKPSQQETLHKIKIENTVPLREIDPPIRDSPQSPDPEPQFVKPNNIEMHDFKNEEIQGPPEHTSVPLPFGQAENNCLSIGGQATLSSNLCSAVGEPVSNARNLLFRGVDLKVPGDRGQCLIKIENQMLPENPGLRDPKRSSQGAGHPNPTTHSDTQSMSVPGITNPRSDMKETGHKGPQIDSVIHGHLPGKLVPDNGGPGSRDPFSAMYNSNTDSRAPVVADERTQNVSCPEKSLQRLKTEETRSQVENSDVKADAMKIGIKQSFGGPQLKDCLPDIGERGQKDRDESQHSEALKSDVTGGGVRDVSTSSLGSRRVQRQSRHDGSPALEERGSQNRGFQPCERDVHLSRVAGVREWSFDSNTSIGLEGRPQMVDRSATTGEKQGAQTNVHMRAPGPNLNYKNGEPSMSFFGQEVPQQDVRLTRSVCGPDTRESETIHERGRPDITGINHKGPSQDVCGIGCTDTRVDRRSSGRASGETGSNRRNADMQERNTQSQNLEKRNEQMGPEVRDMPNFTNPDWRGPGPSVVGPDIRGQRNPKEGLGPHMRDPDWKGPGLDIRGNWRPTEPVRVGSFMQDDWRAHQSDRPGPDKESQGPEKRDVGGLEFRQPGLKMRSPNMQDLRQDRRGPGGPDFPGPRPERRGSDMEVPVHDRREHRGPDSIRSEWQGTTKDSKGPGLRVPGGPQFVGQGLENRGVAEEGIGPDRRGTEGPHFRGSGPEQKVPALESQGPDTRGPAGPDFTGPWPARRGPDVIGTGPDRRGQRGPDFREPGSEKRGPTLEIPGTDRRGHGPGFRVPGPENRGSSMEASGPEKRGPVGPDFSDPGPDSRGRTDFWGPGSERSGHPRDRPGPERRGPTIEGPRTDRKGPGGPDFRAPVPESRELPVVGLGPNGRGQGRPHCREGPGPDRRGPDFRGSLVERLGPGTDTSGLNRTGSGGPKMGRPVFQHAGPNTEGLGPERRVAEGSNVRESGPERRPPDMESRQSDRGGPHFRGVGPDATVMRGQWPTTKGPRGFIASGCESRVPDIEGQGPDRQEPAGSSFRESGLEGRDVEGPGPDWRISSDPNFQGPNIEDVRHEGRGDWEGSDPLWESPGLEVPGFDRPGQNFRGSRPMRRNFRGPRPNWDRGCAPKWSGTGTEEQWSDGRGPNMELGIEREFSEDDWERDGSSGPIQECSDEQGQEHSRQSLCTGWRGRGRRGPGPVQDKPNIFPGHEWNGPGCRRPGPVQDNQDMGCPGPSRGGHVNKWREPKRGGTGTFFREERDSHNRETESDTQGHPDMEGDWRQPDFRGRTRMPNVERPEAYRRGPDSINSYPNRRELGIEGVNRRGPGGPHVRPPRPGNTNLTPEGLESERRRSDCGELGFERHCVDVENSGPGRQDFEQDFRRERRGPKMRRLGPDETDMSSDFRHGAVRFPGSDRRGPDPRRFEPSDVRGEDMRDWEPEQRGQTDSHERPGPHQDTSFQNTSDPCSVPFSRSVRPGPNRGGRSFPAFNNQQNQQPIRPQRPRGALLPTPTEGRIHFPHHPPDVALGRGRPVRRLRGWVRGQGRGSPPIGVNMGGGESMGGDN
uniref:Uncharacterized protein n=3 Tax=Acanthochromis polyacanthus TaxID=80966 RepID=A0A3Q1EDP1_9TELE